MKERILSWLLALAMIIQFIPGALTPEASAAGVSLPETYTAEYDVSKSTSLAIESSGTYRLYGKSSNIYVVVRTTSPVTLVLDGVEMSKSEYTPLELYANANVTLVIKDGTTNKISCTSEKDAANTYSAGILVPETATLTIDTPSGSDGTGTLEVTGGYGGAGIGGGKAETGYTDQRGNAGADGKAGNAGESHVFTEINKTVPGGAGGSGGKGATQGGRYGKNGQSGGTVHIKSGVVTVTGGYGGAGIGGGLGGDGEAGQKGSDAPKDAAGKNASYTHTPGTGGSYTVFSGAGGGGAGGSGSNGGNGGTGGTLKLLKISGGTVTINGGTNAVGVGGGTGGQGGAGGEGGAGGNGASGGNKSQGGTGAKGSTGYVGYSPGGDGGTVTITGGRVSITGYTAVGYGVSTTPVDPAINNGTAGNFNTWHYSGSGGQSTRNVAPTHNHTDTNLTIVGGYVTMTDTQGGGTNVTPTQYTRPRNEWFESKDNLNQKKPVYKVDVTVTDKLTNQPVANAKLEIPVYPTENVGVQYYYYAETDDQGKCVIWLPEDTYVLKGANIWERTHGKIPGTSEQTVSPQDTGNTWNIELNGIPFTNGEVEVLGVVENTGGQNTELYSMTLNFPEHITESDITAIRMAGYLIKKVIVEDAAGTTTEEALDQYSYHLEDIHGTDTKQAQAKVTFVYEDNMTDLKVKAVYNGKELQSYTMKVEKNVEVTVSAPAIVGYTPELTSTKVTCTTDNPTVNVVTFKYTKDTGNVTVIVKDADTSTELYRGDGGTVQKGNTINTAKYSAPDIVFYDTNPTPTIRVNGQVKQSTDIYDGTGDIEVVYEYTRKQKSLTIIKKDIETKQEIAQEVIQNLPAGKVYDFTTKPTIPNNYTEVAGNPTSIMVSEADDQTLTFWYQSNDTKRFVDIQINLVCDGKTFVTYTQTAVKDVETIVKAPSMAGYELKAGAQSSQTITPSGNAAQDVVTFEYTVKNPKTVKIKLVNNTGNAELPVPAGYETTYTLKSGDSLNIVAPSLDGFSLMSAVLDTVDQTNKQVVSVDYNNLKDSETTLTFRYFSVAQANFVTHTIKFMVGNQELYSHEKMIQKGTGTKVTYTNSVTTNVIPGYAFQSISYQVGGKDAKDTEVTDAVDATVIFYFAEDAVTITVKKVDKQGNALTDVNDTVLTGYRKGQTNVTVAAPVVPGYSLVGDATKTVDLTNGSAEVQFTYEAAANVTFTLMERVSDTETRVIKVLNGTDGALYDPNTAGNPLDLTAEGYTYKADDAASTEFQPNGAGKIDSLDASNPQNYLVYYTKQTRTVEYIPINHKTLTEANKTLDSAIQDGTVENYKIDNLNPNPLTAARVGESYTAVAQTFTGWTLKDDFTKIYTVEKSADPLKVYFLYEEKRNGTVEVHYHLGTAHNTGTLLGQYTIEASSGETVIVNAPATLVSEKYKLTNGQNPKTVVVTDADQTVEFFYEANYWTVTAKTDVAGTTSVHERYEVIKGQSATLYAPAKVGYTLVGVSGVGNGTATTFPTEWQNNALTFTPDSDKEVTFHYSAIAQEIVTIRIKGVAAGNKTLFDRSETVIYGTTSKSISVRSIYGYKLESATVNNQSVTVSGSTLNVDLTNAAKGSTVEVVLTYADNLTDFKIIAVYNGQELLTYVTRVEMNVQFTVNAPAIAGYTPNRTSATMSCTTNDPNVNKATFVYTKDTGNVSLVIKEKGTNKELYRGDGGTVAKDAAIKSSSVTLPTIDFYEKAADAATITVNGKRVNENTAYSGLGEIEITFLYQRKTRDLTVIKKDIATQGEIDTQVLSNLTTGVSHELTAVTTPAGYAPVGDNPERFFVEDKDNQTVVFWYKNTGTDQYVEVTVKLMDVTDKANQKEIKTIPQTAIRGVETVINAPSVTGYVLADQKVTFKTITPIGDTAQDVVVFEYVLDAPKTLTVKLVNSTNNTDLPTPTGYVTEYVLKKGDTQVITAPTISGYTLTGAELDGTAKGNGEVVPVSYDDLKADAGVLKFIYTPVNQANFVTHTMKFMFGTQELYSHTSLIPKGNGTQVPYSAGDLDIGYAHDRTEYQVDGVQNATAADVKDNVNATIIFYFVEDGATVTIQKVDKDNKPLAGEKDTVLTGYRKGQTNVVVAAPSVSGYALVGDLTKTVTLNDTNTVVTFQYEPAGQVTFVLKEKLADGTASIIRVVNAENGKTYDPAEAGNALNLSKYSYTYTNDAYSVGADVSVEFKVGGAGKVENVDLSVQKTYVVYYKKDTRSVEYVPVNKDKLDKDGLTLESAVTAGSIDSYKISGLNPTALPDARVGETYTVVAQSFEGWRLKDTNSKTYTVEKDTTLYKAYFLYGEKTNGTVTVQYYFGTAGNATLLNEYTLEAVTEEDVTVTAHATLENGKYKLTAGQTTPQKLTVTGGNQTVKFYYESNFLTVTTYTVLDNGTATEHKKYDVVQGGALSLVPPYRAGYTLVGITGVNGGSATTLPADYNGSLTLNNVDKNMTITYYYTKTPTGGGGGGGGSVITAKYTITATAGKGGSISPSGTVSVSGGSDKAFAFTADNGYRVKDVLVDGKSVGAVDVYVFEKVSGNHTISVTFEAAKPAANGGVADPEDTGVAEWLRYTDHNAYMNGYGDGQFGARDDLNRAQTAQMFYNLLVNRNVEITVSFEDVPSDVWYATAVNTLASLGIVKGVGDGKFEPERSITRAEFTAIATRFAKAVNTTEVSPFDDVNTTDWYFGSVVTAVSYGWIDGYGNGMFGPMNNINRAEAVTIVNRMLARSADREFISANSSLKQFEDVNAKDWFYYQVMEAANGHDHNYGADGYEIWVGLQK